MRDLLALLHLFPVAMMCDFSVAWTVCDRRVLFPAAYRAMRPIAADVGPSGSGFPRRDDRGEFSAIAGELGPPESGFPRRDDRGEFTAGTRLRPRDLVPGVLVVGAEGQRYLESGEAHPV